MQYTAHGDWRLILPIHIRSVLNERKSPMSKLRSLVAGRGLPDRDRNSRLSMPSPEGSWPERHFHAGIQPLPLHGVSQVGVGKSLVLRHVLAINPAEDRGLEHRPLPSERRALDGPPVSEFKNSLRTRPIDCGECLVSGHESRDRQRW